MCKISIKRTLFEGRLKLTITIASHTHGEKVLVRSCTLHAGNPEIVDILRIGAVVPGPSTKKPPFDRDATHQRLLMAGAHHNPVPIGQRLILQIIDTKCASDR